MKKRERIEEIIGKAPKMNYDVRMRYLVLELETTVDLNHLIEMLKTLRDTSDRVTNGVLSSWNDIGKALINAEVKV